MKMRMLLTSLLPAALMVALGMGWPSVPVAAASRTPANPSVLAGKDITTPTDTIKLQTYNRQGRLLSTKTVKAPPTTYIEYRVEPLSTARAQGLAYVPLPAAPTQFHQAAAELHKIIAKQEGVSGQGVDPTIGCNQSIRATGAYQFSDANTTVNYAVSYNTYAGNCGIAITDYASNLNPSTNSTVYQCNLTWQNDGYNYNPNVPIPNYYPNDTWYNAGDLGWNGGGGSNFYTYAGLNGCSIYDNQA